VGNSKEIAMVDNAVKVEVNVVKEDPEAKEDSVAKVADNVEKVVSVAKVADNVEKVASEVRVDSKKKAASKKKVVDNVVKAGSSAKVAQVRQTVTQLSENHSRKNHNQFKESIS
jgi:hypothetical protein